VLTYDQNFCIFTFDGLSFKQPEGTRYTYRLTGLDTAWSDILTQRAVTFVSLSPGKYTFEVHAIAATGLRSITPASISFTILRPWYLSWWTIGLYIVFGSIGIVTYTRLRTRMLEFRSVELARAVEARTSEVVEQRNRLRDQAERLRHLNFLKSHFFTNISHEFRTPLTVILGHLDRLAKGKGIGSELSIMERNAQRLLQLINQLLDLSKLEAGAMTLRTSITDIVDFTLQIVGSFGSYASHKGIGLTFNGAPASQVSGQPSLLLHIDTDKMEKVLNNLLSNALKFTPKGGSVNVIIIGGASGEDGVADRVEIRVRDTGPGIPSTKLPFVFDRFYQVEDYAKPGVEGTGVGLALVKELVELHHGSVSVTSEVGKGSEFSITLPTGTAHLDDGEIIQENYDGKISTRTPLLDDVTEEKAPQPGDLPPDSSVLLIVEDNADLRAYMRSQFEDDFEVIEADNGTTGFELAERYVPDIVVSDIMMPGIDGIALCAALKSTDKANHIPVILLTAKATIDNRLEGLETGADDYLTKPFVANELEVRVRNLIASRRQLRGKYSKALLLRPSEIEVPSRQQEFLDRILIVMERHIGEEGFSVELLAQEMAMSRSQLHRKLKAYTTQSPNEMIRSFRLRRAADLIEKDAGTLSEIAYRVGFSSQAYFTRCFVEEFQCTPSEHRKKTSTPPAE
jgi:signal transduction histidine kinase/DNA-binding response OmpR family regulator